MGLDHVSNKPVSNAPVKLNSQSIYEYAVNLTCDAEKENTLVTNDDMNFTGTAIAKDKDGELIDPFNGVQDIHNKILRHVSLAFSEDPVRILRVARFAARYYHVLYQFL